MDIKIEIDEELQTTGGYDKFKKEYSLVLAESTQSIEIDRLTKKDMKHLRSLIDMLLEEDDKDTLSGLRKDLIEEDKQDAVLGLGRKIE